MKSNFKNLNELPNTILDPKYFQTDNFLGLKVAGYVSGDLFLSLKAFEALKLVALEVKKQNLGLKIFDAYRPIKAVEFFYNWTQTGQEEIERKMRFYPHLDKKNLFNEGYLALFSSHTRGSAVDLTLVNENLREMDMGSEFDFFGDLSHTFNSEISDSQRENRQILYDVMSEFGFENYSREWWHYRLKQEMFPETYFDFDQ